MIKNRKRCTFWWSYYKMVKDKENRHLKSEKMGEKAIGFKENRDCTKMKTRVYITGLKIK